MKSGVHAVLLIALVSFASALSGCEFWQYNIANGNNGPHTGQNDVVWNIAVKGARPAAMGLEEVCGGSSNVINDSIARYGYHGDFDGGLGTCGGQRYGNAIFHLGRHIPISGHPDGIVTGRYSSQQSHTRGYLGIAIDASGNKYMMWVTHLESCCAGVAADQAWQLLQTVLFYRDVTHLPQIVAGDFNLRPDQWPMNAWCDNFPGTGEANQCRGKTHGDDQIDYLFSSLPWNRGAAYFTGQSDHALVVGGFG